MLNRFGAAFVRSHRPIVSAWVATVLSRLQICRTAALGGHARLCLDCGKKQISYNSCRDRHCPKCGGAQRARWLDAQSANLLPVPYFHIVFTLPHELGPLALQNEKVVYGLLFRAASQTLLQLAADAKHLGAQIGVTAVLHTWGQNLNHHPHVHCVVTGGGLSLDGTRWVRGRRRFFISVRVMRALFRGKLLALLGGAYRRGELQLHGRLLSLRQPAAFFRLLKPLRKKKWVVHAKPPFGGPQRVLKYLARYTHRVAIANQRIVEINATGVVFRWKDYRDGQRKVMALRAAEFLRRFSLHVLPKRFVRIRHYGLLANAKRAKVLLQCRASEGFSAEELTAIQNEPVVDDAEPMPVTCSACGSAAVVSVIVLPLRSARPVVFALWCDST